MRLLRFGDYVFTTISAEDDYSDVISPNEHIDTTGGAYDPNIGYDNDTNPFTISRRQELFGTSPENLQTQIDAALALARHTSEVISENI